VVSGRFRRWLQAQRREDGPVGDLARDVFIDPTWPDDAASVEDLEDYLWCEGACDDALKALRQAWEEFEAAERGGAK
jgi:uncharacterized protein YozE (UPF0346 family)